LNTHLFLTCSPQAQGAFEEANGGTIFLDEIGELTLDLQPKLLRALEQREIKRVGSNVPIKIDVRVICATNKNLTDLSRKGVMREDFYYRIHIIPISLPPSGSENC
jgi:transcriptional regulator with GAF, ATPase, and Fis domain